MRGQRGDRFRKFCLAQTLFIVRSKTRSKTNNWWWRCFAESHLPSLCPANKIEQNFHFPLSSAIGIERNWLEPRTNGTKSNQAVWNGIKSNQIERSWVRYLDKQKSDIFMFRNRKLIGGRGNWKKNHARQLTLKNIFIALKKLLQGKCWRKKIHAARKFLIPPPPPITFLMVRP